MEREWILVTGPTHGGTRLLAKVLARHPEIAAPSSEDLSVAEDYRWLHVFFIDAVSEMGLHEEGPPVDEDELAFVLDAYEQVCGEGRYGLVKMPNYPLMAREAFENVLDLAMVVYTSRPWDEILASKRKRGREVRMVEDHQRFVQQTKKCLPEDRARVLNAHDFETLHEAQMEATRARFEAWRQADAGPTVTQLDAHELASRREALAEMLDELGLSRQPVDRMLDVVDEDRLASEGVLDVIKRQGLRGKNNLQAWVEMNL